MTSEIKVDTISEQTSANGVTIDGLTIKDGNIIGDVALAGTTPTFTIGDAGAEDASLIFDGNAQDFYVALDDSADDLVIGLGNTIGTTPIMSFDENKDVVIHDGGLTITTADNTNQLTLVSTDADGGAGPKLTLQRDSGSPADGDVGGRIHFVADDDAGNTFEAALIDVTLNDVSNGSEDATLDIKGVVAGSEIKKVSFGAETVFNEDSADIDFRVESNGNANMLFVDGGNDKVGIGTSSPTTTLSVNGIITHTGGTASSTSDLTSGGLHFHDASTADGDIMPITFTPSATADRARAGIGFKSVSAGGSAGFAADIAFYTRSAADGSTLGTSDERMRINADGQVLIGGANATFGELGITGASNGDANIDMYASVGSGTRGKAEIFFSTDSSSDHVSIASIVAQQPSGDQAARKGEILLNVSDNGGPATALTVSNNGTVSGNLNDTSDENLKKNITDLGASTDLIKALKPRQFDWKQTSAGSNIAGFVAQEVATVIPTAVVGNDYIATTYYIETDDIPEGYAIGDIKDHGDKGKALNTTAILAHAVKTIQELEARITTLEG